MGALGLSQREADLLLAAEKHRIDSQKWFYPAPGKKINVPLVGARIKEKFILDISRGKISLYRGNFQNRARQIQILVRLDFGGRPHKNPDGDELPCPHLHIFREGYGVKWAIPVPMSDFPNIHDPWLTLQDFYNFCNITKPPVINKVLFQ
jgi:hypothetical protein